MQKLFSAKKIRKADQFTIEEEPISSIDLMERAATKTIDWILKYASKEQIDHFSVFCGTGNNGGDGLAIARLLHLKGFVVEVFLLQLGQYSTDCKENLSRLQINPVNLNEEEYSFQIDGSSLVIDAIFGTGISRPIEGFAAEVMDQINRSINKVISIDLPSGLEVENIRGINNRTIVKSDFTVSFQFPKLSFLFPESQNYVGQWEIVDIGLSKIFIEEEDSNHFYTQREDIKNIIKPRASNAHKGTFGHACLLAGSEGKIGAAVLAAKACLRSGVGLLTIRLPKVGGVILQSAVPEAMVLKDESEKELVNTFDTSKYTSIGIGPGIGTSNKTQTFLANFLDEIDMPMVVDADALNILSMNKALLDKLPKGSILTPHPGEFKRLVGEWESDYDRLQLQIALAAKYQLIVILKGKNTSIAAADGKVYFNSTGNPGMATGGSGDVLTGILTALLAQGYSPIHASLLGVYIHGLAGDLAAEQFGEEAMIASDIVGRLGEAFKLMVKK